MTGPERAFALLSFFRICYKRASVSLAGEVGVTGGKKTLGRAPGLACRQGKKKNNRGSHADIDETRR